MVLLIRADGDLTRLVRAAPPWTDPARALPSLTVLPHEYEFDGQFFYRLGIQPFSTAPEVAGVTFDLPALRASRWGLGLTAHLLSFGKPALVPWVIPALNVLCLIALGCLGGMLARDSGRTALWGLLLPLWPGFAYTLTLDTSELLASMLACAALVAARRRAFVWAAVVLSAAVVTRETAMVVAVGSVAGGIWDRYRRRADGSHDGWGQVVVGCVGAAAFALSQVLVGTAFGQLPLLSSAGNNAGPPFVGIYGAITEWLTALDASHLMSLISLVLAAGMLMAGAISIRRSTARAAEKVAWACSAVLFVTLNGNPLVSAPSIMRAATELGLLTIIVLLGSRSRLVVPAAIGIVLVGAATMGTMIISMPPGG
jgi:hypothetical protein